VFERRIRLTDYYPILVRAIGSLDANTAQTRAALFERAKGMMLEQIRSDPTRWSEAAIKDEIKSFNLAVDRIESDLASNANGRLRRNPTHQQRQPPGRQEDWSPHDRRIPQATKSFGRTSLLTTVAIGGLLLSGLIAYTYLSRNHSPAPPDQDPGRMVAKETSNTQNQIIAMDADELAPGIDGGSTDAGLPYFLRRHAVYYRSVYSDGMIVIDRSQRHLYLLQPQSRAWRYGIGIGGECPISAGFQRVTEKTEWPEWSASPEQIKRRYPAHLPGGPGNPYGARAIYFEHGMVGIHGTNAPKTIGEALSLGCFRLVNDDAVDLDRRVLVGAGVVVLN
jgi:lipoprotein-anchoring transpeptidase ErfK/SrfK